jgi:CheY-like chemotaxis protein
MVRNLAAAILEKAGYTVLQAANGEEAMVRFRKAAPEIDLLLLDVVMPGLGGRALYEQARALKPEIAVLFASGYSDNAVRANFALGKGLPLLSKPFSREELLAAVREVLDATKNGAGQEPAQ